MKSDKRKAGSTSAIPTNLAAHRLASQPHALKGLDALAILTSYYRGQEICAEGRPAELWFCVMSGGARQCASRADGRRQILGLLLPGDFFGFTLAYEFSFTVEAVAEGTVVAAYSRKRAEALANSNPEIARELREVAIAGMGRLQSQILTLGRITAIEKVGSFLLELARRSSHGAADDLALPISRYDIADYLAVSVETVSRAFTDLRQRGVISFSGPRTLKILDPDALEEGGPSGPTQHPPSASYLSAAPGRADS